MISEKYKNFANFRRTVIKLDIIGDKVETIKPFSWFNLFELETLKITSNQDKDLNNNERRETIKTNKYF